MFLMTSTPLRAERTLARMRRALNLLSCRCVCVCVFLHVCMHALDALCVISDTSKLTKEKETLRARGKES